MTEFDAIGFGALNVDRLFKANKIAGKNEESFVIECQESCGGSAANTVVGLARLGFRTGFIGKVANDREGQLLLESFRRENVDTKGIAISKRGRSGVVMGFVDKEGERALYVAPGVNDKIIYSRINKAYVKRTRLLHLTSFVSETSFESQKQLLKNIPDEVKISFDPGMLYAKRGLSALQPIIKRTFALLPNRTELKILTGKDYVSGSEKLIDEGAKLVGVKLGNRGCFITNGNESHVIDSFKVKVIDTTGAGDAWNAGFLYSVISGKSLKASGRFGNFVASKCIMKIGARDGLPRLAGLKAYF